MYLARLKLNQTRLAIGWVANPYRVHQRLRLAYPNDRRLLFRIEPMSNSSHQQILIQSHTAPDWSTAFDDFRVLAAPPDYKTFAPQLVNGQRYRFRLLANPTVKRAGKRYSLFKIDEQQAWLSRKLMAIGAEVLSTQAMARGLQRSRKNPAKDERLQTHFAVLYEGVLIAADAESLQVGLENGIGSAKGYGFGLLSLGRP